MLRRGSWSFDSRSICFLSSLCRCTSCHRDETGALWVHSYNVEGMCEFGGRTKGEEKKSRKLKLFWQFSILSLSFCIYHPKFLSMWTHMEIIHEGQDQEKQSRDPHSCSKMISNGLFIAWPPLLLISIISNSIPRIHVHLLPCNDHSSHGFKTQIRHFFMLKSQLRLSGKWRLLWEHYWNSSEKKVSRGSVNKQI